MMYVKHFVTCKALCTHVGDCSHYGHYLKVGSGRPEGISMGSSWGCTRGGQAQGLPKTPSGTAAWAVVRSIGWMNWALDPQGQPKACEHHGFDHLCSRVPPDRVSLQFWPVQGSRTPALSKPSFHKHLSSACSMPLPM